MNPQAHYDLCNSALMHLATVDDRIEQMPGVDPALTALRGRFKRLLEDELMKSWKLLNAEKEGL